MKTFPNPLAKAAFGALTYLDRDVKTAPNPLAKAAWGSFTYIDRSPEEPSKVPNLLLSFSINDECNLQCKHCVEKEFKRGEDKYDLVKRRTEELPEESIVWASIAGKEPTATPNRLAEFAKLLRARAKKVIVMTNGHSFSPRLQEKLNGNVHYVDFSVDGLESYKSLDGIVWENIREAARNGFEKVSILSTLMDGSSSNWRDVRDFSAKIADDFNEKVAHSIGFYLGWPKDERLLSEDQIVETIRRISSADFKTTIQIPLSYSRFLPRIFKEFGLDLKDVKFDSSTGIPSYDLNGHTLIIASHLETSIHGLRAEVDGKVYFGCSHLMVGGDASRFAVGDLGCDSFEDIRRILSGSELVEAVSEVDPACKNSGCFEYCRGGDRVGGYIHTGKAKDPFCSVIN